MKESNPHDTFISFHTFQWGSDEIYNMSLGDCSLKAAPVIKESFSREASEEESNKAVMSRYWQHQVKAMRSSKKGQEVPVCQHQHAFTLMKTQSRIRVYLQTSPVSMHDSTDPLQYESEILSQGPQFHTLYFLRKDCWIVKPKGLGS